MGKGGGGYPPIPLRKKTFFLGPKTLFFAFFYAFLALFGPLYSLFGPFLTLFNENIAKGTTDPRVEFLSQVQTQILIKFYLQNLDQASSSKSQPNISLSIKLELQNLDQT